MDIIEEVVEKKTARASPWSAIWHGSMRSAASANETSRLIAVAYAGAGLWAIFGLAGLIFGWSLVQSLGISDLTLLAIAVSPPIGAALLFHSRIALHVLAACTALSVAIYGLARVALLDLPAPHMSSPGDGGMTEGHASALWIDRDGTARLDEGGAIVSLGGHRAPVTQAFLLNHGAEALTVAEDGAVRVAPLCSDHRERAVDHPWLCGARWRSILDSPRLGPVLRTRLWEPYGAPLARAALFAATQIVPMDIPEPARGRRGRIFRDCPQCPEMVEIEPGSFLMGTPLEETGRNYYEAPRHLVTISQPFAVGRYAVTFDEWDACAAAGPPSRPQAQSTPPRQTPSGLEQQLSSSYAQSQKSGLRGICRQSPSDQGWGRGRRPVINISWDDAKEYVAWLSSTTGKSYRLLTEAEREYAARAGTTTAYPWGDTIGKGNANCLGCGGEWDGKQTAPVGSFAPNGFGLYDMSGNVWEWIEDCSPPSYAGAPTDGSAWPAPADCSVRVRRGGSWDDVPRNLRSASRIWLPTDIRYYNVGFRVARTLSPPAP
jgi:formylglycine-generating enzyme required for sulfatase activity